MPQADVAQLGCGMKADALALGGIQQTELLRVSGKVQDNLGFELFWHKRATSAFGKALKVLEAAFWSWSRITMAILIGRLRSAFQRSRLCAARFSKEIQTRHCDAKK